MIHKDKAGFQRALELAAAASGFPMRLLEKDYYLTAMLGGINSGLDEKLIFKGGTCLNKAYFDYFRLSEDLDFTLVLEAGKINRAARSRGMEGVKKKIAGYAKNRGLAVNTGKNPGRNENKQYVFYLEYDSIVAGTRDSIKLEVGLRANPLLPPVKMKVKHLFKNPFTREELFDAGGVMCLCLEELAAEKLRAAATRKRIAPRDFFDLYYFIEKGFDFRAEGFEGILKKKLAEDGFDFKGREFYVNLLRDKDEIEDMKKREKDELYPVLTAKAAEGFNVDKVLDYFRGMGV